MKRTILILAACAALTALAVPAMAPAVTGNGGATAASTKKKAKPKTYKVGVANYYYTKPNLTLKVGDKITWKWPAAGGDAHDVALEQGQGPKGVKPWTSPTYQAAVSWSKTFKVKGTYNLICTLHPDTMTMVVKVKK